LKRLFLASVSASMLLGVAVASAQGLPPGSVPPVYGSKVWSVNRQASSDRDVRMSDMRQAGSSQSPDAAAAGQPAKRPASKIDG
jgi:hypothetical protein